MTLIKAADPLARRIRQPEIRLVTAPRVQDPPMTAAERGTLEGVVEELSAQKIALETKVADLEDALAAGRAEVARAVQDHATALAEAKVSAYEEGRAAGEAAKSEALERLDAGLAHATGRLTADLQGLETLAVYLRENANLRRSAEALFVHVNTVTYRLRRIEALTGLSLGDGSDRLVAQLAIEVIRTGPVSERRSALARPSERVAGDGRP